MFVIALEVNLKKIEKLYEWMFRQIMGNRYL